METKKHDRELVFRRREQMGEELARINSERILERILSLPLYREKEHLLVYVDFNREVGTHGLIRQAWADGKQVAVPRVRRGVMEFIRLSDFSQLGKGYYGIMEPVGDERVDWADALMIMPGVAFDRELHRIGYGGGFYDRYLEKRGGLSTVALAFDFQVFDQVPAQETDIRPELLVTEREILKRAELLEEII